YSSTPTVSYCVIETTSSPLRYGLYRATGTGATDCTAGDTTRMLVADSLTSSSVFTTDAIPQYSLQTIGIDIKVGIDSASTTENAYELTDSIVARNSNRCTGSSTCAVTAVP